MPQSTVKADLKALLESAGEPVDAGKLGDVSSLLDNLTSLKHSYATKARYAQKHLRNRNKKDDNGPSTKLYILR